MIEMGDRMVPRMMGEGAGNMIRQWCEKQGVRVYTGTRIEAIEQRAPLSVRLSNGEHLPADLIISATGVKPNIGFLEFSDVKCLQGILVDESMQTNIPGIYAAGDCAEAFDFITGHTIVSAIQPNAADQARCAALNMCGKNAIQPTGVPVVVSGLSAKFCVRLLLAVTVVFGSSEVLALWKQYTAALGAVLVVWAYALLPRFSATSA